MINLTVEESRKIGYERALVTDDGKIEGIRMDTPAKAMKTLRKDHQKLVERVAELEGRIDNINSVGCKCGKELGE